MRQTTKAEVCLDEGQATSFGPARQETGRFGCQRGWLRLNFVAVCLDETKNRARRAGNPGNVGWNLDEFWPLPQAEYVVMQGSLYHFLPEPSRVIDRMIAAAEKQVLIAEPIRKMTDSRILPLAVLARKLTNPGTGDQPNRFNEASLDLLMEQYRARGHDVQSRLIAGGREKLCLWFVRGEAT